MIKKVVSKKIPKQVEVVETKPEELQAQGQDKPRKKCFFCQGKTSPSYTDIVLLNRFLTDRGRITPKLRSGLCSKHQRSLTRHIKYARHLSLLSFTPKV